MFNTVRAPGKILKPNRYLYFSLIIFISIQLLAFTKCFGQEKIVAIVNNDIITQKDVNDFLNFIRVQLSEEFKGKELEDKITESKQDLLDQLIDDKLIIQEAKKSGTTVDEGRIKSRLAEIKKRYPTDADFQNGLSQQGLSQADVEKRLREQMLMYAFIEQKIREKITVTPAEVTDFYKANASKFTSGESREFELLKFSSEEQARKASLDIAKGIGVGEAAKLYGLQPGTVGPVQREELRPQIGTIVFGLKDGEVSDLEKIDSDYYIFHLSKIIPPAQKSLPEVQDFIRGYMFDNKMKESMSKWLDEVKKKAYIKVLSTSG